MTKWPVQKQTHRTTHRHVEHGRTQRRNIHSKTLVCVFRMFLFSFFFIYNFLNDFPSNVEFTDFLSGFKPVLSYSKPHTFSTFFGEEKEINVQSLSPTRPLRS